MASKLSHVGDNNLPKMVDVSEKVASARVAVATGSVQLPEIFREQLDGKEIFLKKGPVFQTAVIAGTMAVKRTHDMIPFCHALPIEGCRFDISVDDSLIVKISCEVKTTYKTGVEMEALHGVSVAALTVYDMCKALSHDIVIGPQQLIQKSGGKSDYVSISQRPLYGLVLTGGKSRRMNADKALISYHGKAHAKYLYELLDGHCEKVFLSSQEGQWIGTELEGLPSIADADSFTAPSGEKITSKGPIVGILSAMEKFPEADLLVLACDLAQIDEANIKQLMASHNSKESQSKVATSFISPDGEFPEALCAIYTPAVKADIFAALKNDIRCPVKILKNADIQKVTALNAKGSLANFNTPEDRARFVPTEPAQ